MYIHTYIQTYTLCITILYLYVHINELHTSFPSFQILMSAVIEHTTAPKYVQILQEASFVYVIVVIYWTLME